MRLEQGGAARDAWRNVAGRASASTPARRQRDTLTLQGDIYSGDEQLQSAVMATVERRQYPGPLDSQLLGDSDMSLQVYYDRTHLMLPVPAALVAPAGSSRTISTRTTWTFSTASVGSRQRSCGDSVIVSRTTTSRTRRARLFLPAVLDQNLFSGFVQDEISLREDLALTLGTKLEHNDYTGFEIRAQRPPAVGCHERQSLWAAVSRAVRTPSRIDRDISQPIPVISSSSSKVASGSSRRSCWPTSSDRGQLGSRSHRLALDLLQRVRRAAQHFRQSSRPVFGLPFPFFFENNLEGTTWGFELSADAQLLERGACTPRYRLLGEDLRVVPGKSDFNNTLNETARPGTAGAAALLARSSRQPGTRCNLPLGWTIASRTTRAYRRWSPHTELDLRLAWRPSPAVELSIAGRKLLHSEHVEYGVPGPGRVALQRQVYGSVTWRH